jgi:hypothetical protein
MPTVSPDSESPAPSTKALRKLKLPLGLLAVDGVNPEQGDEVSFTVTGKLSAVSGEDGEVSRVNDADLAEPAPEMDEDGAALDAARKADLGEGY